MIFKLWERRAKCHMATRNFSQAVEDVKLALKYLECSNLSDEKKEGKEKELKKVASLMERELKNFQSETENGDADISEEDRNVKLTLENPNPRFPHLSEAVQIKYAPNRGRYAVAARDIKIGECYKQTISI